MGGMYRIEYLCNKKISGEQLYKLEKKYLGYWRIYETRIGMLRTKLAYVPVIFATALAGPPERGYYYKHFLKIVDSLSRDFFHEFKWKWSGEDQKLYEELKSKYKFKIKRIYPDTKQLNIFWPVSVLAYDKVREEVEKVKRGLFSAEDERDKKIILDCKGSDLYEIEGKTRKMKEWFDEGKVKQVVEKENNLFKRYVADFCDGLLGIRNELGEDFWFTLEYS